MKLNIKMTLITIVIFLITMGISSIITILYFSSNYTNMLLIGLEGLGNNLLSVVDELLEYGLSIINLDGMEKKCADLVRRNNQIASYVFIADKYGKILYHNNTDMMGKILNDTPMSKSLKSKKVFYQQYKINNITYYDLTFPITTSDNNQVGVIRIGSPANIIDKKVYEITFLAFIVFIISSFFFATVIIFTSQSITKPLKMITETASRIAAGEINLKASVKGKGEVGTLANAFNSMTEQLNNKITDSRKLNMILLEIITKAKQIIINLNSTSKEIEVASQEQLSSTSENASSITEVGATLQELSITAKQITGNVGELVLSSEEVVKLLKENEKLLLQTVTQFEEMGLSSASNAAEIAELGKRSAIINEMAEVIKEVANKTNILSINASIEASQSGEAGTRFSVVAAEIRELSKETIDSAKKAELAAKEIQNFLKKIITSAERESQKVIEGVNSSREILDKIESIVSKINNNYTFTQKINVSIKQQESGSIQAAETMRQMAEISRQSAETVRQTLSAVKDIVNLSAELEQMVIKSGHSEALV